METSTLDTLMTDARQIIQDLGMGNSLRSNTSLYVFLTLLGMSPGMKWSQADNKLWGITPLMEEINIQGFASFKDFKKTIKVITWETHAWLAENPTHMIHFNGDRYWVPLEK